MTHVKRNCCRGAGELVEGGSDRRLYEGSPTKQVNRETELSFLDWRSRHMDWWEQHLADVTATIEKHEAKFQQFKEEIEAHMAAIRDTVRTLRPEPERKAPRLPEAKKSSDSEAASPSS